MKSSLLYLGGLMAFTASVVLADTGTTADPSNSANNATNTVTSANQSNAQTDIDITAAIRHHLVKDSRLSTDAKNVKIVTSGGKVILMGPVDSTEEEKIIFHHAQMVAGKTNVDNQLSVK